MTDYYSILGLQKGASIEEIKKAYKKLAKQHHPDISKDPNAEKKFKEIVEAYQVLSDPEKKQNYDNYGDAYKNFQGYQQGFGQGMDFDFEDIFNQFGFDFGGGFGDLFGSRKREKKDFGKNIKIDLTINFEEAVFGVEKNISYERIQKCSFCKGTGAENSRENVCNVCNGRGVEIRQQRTPFGIFQSQSTCRKCKGTGKIPEKNCSNCQGSGFETKTNKIKIKIPAGINIGNHLRLKEKGHEGKDGVGDLYIVIFVEPHDIFKRDEEDIYAEIPISFSESALGATVEVPTLKGTVELKIPAGTQTGTIFRLKKKGIKVLNSNLVGDEYIKVIIETPKKLSKKQKELLEQLKKEDEFNKKRKSIFKKIFENF
ncbi:MAG: molecular chaperone DnaJ [Candidatus ainarchaeum sp.]|nr:molecular chaperone DnaJ [Candidatus ainarchaeum sp.]